ncbi:MAG TPA: hypothetical protein VGH07_07965 [Chthoniobacterales bacterium]|jgi:hypothetical protein
MSERHNLTDTPELKGFVDTAIEIADARRQTLQRMRTALEADDRDEVLKLARELCGVRNDEQARN